MKNLFRWFKRLWRLANPDIVQVMCPGCNDLVGAYERHDCVNEVRQWNAEIVVEGER